MKFAFMKQKTVVGSVMAVVLTLGMQSAVSAADAKEFLGAACKPLETGISNLPHNRFDGRFKALDTMVAVCPVVRDKATNTNGINYAYIRVTRAAGNPSPRCQFQSLNKHGKNAFIDNFQSFPVGDSHRKFDLDSSNNRGSYLFACTLNNGDSINSYKVSEN